MEYYVAGSGILKWDVPMISCQPEDINLILNQLLKKSFCG